MRVPKAERQTKTESQKIWKWKVVHKMRRINACPCGSLPPPSTSTSLPACSTCHMPRFSKWNPKIPSLRSHRYNNKIYQNLCAIRPTRMSYVRLPYNLAPPPPQSQPSRWPSLALPASSHKPKPKANAKSNNKRNTRAKQSHTSTHTHWPLPLRWWVRQRALSAELLSVLLECDCGSAWQIFHLPRVFCLFCWVHIARETAQIEKILTNEP